MKREPCKPCAAARKMMPAPVRRRLEDLERRMAEDKLRQEADRARRQA
jgi:hypothetical protein